MPSAPLTFRATCGSFVPVFMSFMLKRAIEKTAMRIAMLTPRTRGDGVTLGLLLTYFFWGSLLLRCGDVERNPGPGDDKPSMKQTRLSSSRLRGTDRKGSSTDSGQTTSSPQEPSRMDLMDMLQAMNSTMNYSQLDMTPVVAVFGATGGQGASVARALAACGQYSVRGLTRDVATAHAQQLHDLSGVNMVLYDPYDAKSVRSALAGAHAVFVNTVTDYCDPNCFENEKTQGRLIADACLATGVGHVIFSSQLHTTRISGSLVRHMVAKAEIEDYMRDKGLPVTFLIMPIYYEDFCGLFKPMTRDGCNFELYLPTGFTPLDLMSVEDLGPVVLKVLRRGQKSFYRTICPCGDKLTMNEVAFVLSKYLAPKTFRDKQLTVPEFSQLGLPGATDWAQMFKFLSRQDQIHQKQEMDQPLMSFEAWVAQNRDTIDRAMC